MLTTSCNGKSAPCAHGGSLLRGDKAVSVAVQVFRQLECTGITGIMSATGQGVEALELTIVTCLISITTSVVSTNAVLIGGHCEFSNILARLTTRTRH